LKTPKLVQKSDHDKHNTKEVIDRIAKKSNIEKKIKTRGYVEYVTREACPETILWPVHVISNTSPLLKSNPHLAAVQILSRT
jgi:hypothetical protein